MNLDPYAKPAASSGVIPAKDYNAPTPPHNSGDPMEKPGFLKEAYEELVAIRQELSKLYAQEMGSRNKGLMSSDSYYSADQLSVSAMERKADFMARRCKLEEREAALMAYCSQYKYVASLGDAPATEDEPGEAANSATSGATARVGRR